MPLLDHFHPPLSERRPWESFHATWCSALADHLNTSLLPPGFIALEHVNPGAAIEIDVGAFTEESAESWSKANGSTATLARTVWTPSAPPLIMGMEFLESYTVEVHSNEGGRTLVAAVELVSPGNKDRASKRRLFAAKCASYLARGIGLIVVDVVTSRHANMHNELIDLVRLGPAFKFDEPIHTYVAGYRPIRRDDQDQVEAWPMPLTVGMTLPRTPLSLSAECCLAVDLEASYADACRRRRVADAL